MRLKKLFKSLNRRARRASLFRWKNLWERDFYREVVDLSVALKMYKPFLKMENY